MTPNDPDEDPAAPLERHTKKLLEAAEHLYGGKTTDLMSVVNAIDTLIQAHISVVETIRVLQGRIRLLETLMGDTEH
jgi:hypothetical protein